MMETLTVSVFGRNTGGVFWNVRKRLTERKGAAGGGGERQVGGNREAGGRFVERKRRPGTGDFERFARRGQRDGIDVKEQFEMGKNVGDRA